MTTRPTYDDLLCVGEIPLTARWWPWMDAISDDPDLCRELIDAFGSPVHLHCPDPFIDNIRDLRQVATRHGVEFSVFFARKANKALAYVDAARDAGAGVDVASLEELEHCLDAAVDPRHIVITAAVKSAALIERAVAVGAMLTIDNDDEAEQIGRRAAAVGREVSVAVRLRDFSVADGELHSRFGVAVSDAASSIRRWTSDFPELTVVGLHFHLDGYRGSDRAAATAAALRVADSLDQPVRFIDIGGGFPARYLVDDGAWRQYWDELAAALFGRRPPITYRNHGFGLTPHGDELIGRREAYPHGDQATSAAWLDQILAASTGDPEIGSGSIAEALRSRAIALHCEPGRALLEGCGLTLARVEHRKQVDGDQLIGLAMNGTNCRSRKSELFTDPRLIPTGKSKASKPGGGYITGAYCTESDLIMHRRLLFPRGVRQGDTVAFANTAGYLMHFTESRSHAFPLPVNLVINGDGWNVDRCDAERVPSHENGPPNASLRSTGHMAAPKAAQTPQHEHADAAAPQQDDSHRTRPRCV